MITFKIPKEDRKVIEKIVDRGVLHAAELGIDYERQDMEMDIIACHANGMKLDLPKFLAAPDASFGHDLFGIRRFIDRSTGKMSPRFEPRCSMPEKRETNKTRQTSEAA